MVSVVEIEFSVTRCQPLRRALCVLPTPAYLLVLEPRKTASVLDHRASGAAN